MVVRRVGRERLYPHSVAPRPQQLLTPGPTAVPPEVLSALARPVLHHRSPDFAEVFALAQERLRAVFRTESEVLVFTASGTGAFESAIVNLLSPGERVLAVSQGEFGERWQAMARAFGCDVVPLAYAWGESPRPDDLRAALDESGARTVFLVHSETSTGVVCDLEPLLAVCAEAGAVSVVDAVSSLGAVPLETDAWGADVVVTGLAEGTDDAARPRVRRGLRPGMGADAARRRCRASTGTGSGSGRARRSSRRRSRRRRRPSSRSRRRSGSCSPTGSRRRSPATARSAGPAAPGSRRWASSCTRPTTTAPRC